MLMLSAHLGAIHEIETGRVIQPPEAAELTAARAARLHSMGVAPNPSFWSRMAVRPISSSISSRSGPAAPPRPVSIPI